MKTYEVLYRVEGVSGTCAVIVQAPDQGTARRVALAQISSQAGYIGKKVYITHTRTL